MVFANLTVMENLRMGAYLDETRNGSPPISNTSSESSRASKSAKNRPPEPSAAANSKCSPSGGR